MSDRKPMPVAATPVYEVTGTTPPDLHARAAFRNLQPTQYSNSFNGVGYSGLISLLRDLRHLCDVTGVDFEACLTAATCEYETERRSAGWQPEPNIGDPSYRADFMRRHGLTRNTENLQ